MAHLQRTEETELFHQYDEEFTTLILSINNRISSQIPSYPLGSTDRAKVIRETERELSEAKDSLAHMEMEIHSIPTAQRPALLAKIRENQASLDKAKVELRRASTSTAAGNANRNALFGTNNATSDTVAINIDGAAGSPDDFSRGSVDQRQRLLAGTDRLQDSSRRLEDAHRVALETEAMGASIMGDLLVQRERIVRTRDTLMRADSNLDRAQRTIKTMARR
ncbi:V-snare-domain-containing protein [Ramicandelaber brevisporus]|nr:V-snare-domain-containing protein [Ramicandelaber brevisporus]